MKIPKIALAALSSTLVLLGESTTEQTNSEVELIRIEHEVREIEGWTVHVDASLLEGEHQEMGELALRILAQRLHEIVLRIPEEPVARMQEVPIYLDRNHPMGNNHYHPGADWLVERGYDPDLTGAIHITHARTLIREASNPRSSSVTLHELAHAYHDQVLGFDHPGILEAYQKFCDSRKFDRVATLGGRQMPHYGLTDHKEFFAEMTETFFIGNYYYPFNHYELYHTHRPSYELMAEIWGTDIQPPQREEFYQPSILDLRIMANLKSQRGEFEQALELVAQAKARSSDAEGRLAKLKEEIEARQAQSER